jgi:hypothetical protein
MVYSEKKFLDQLINIKENFSIPMRTNKIFVETKIVAELLDIIDVFVEIHTSFYNSINQEYEKNGLNSIFAPYFTILTTKVDKYKTYSLLWQKVIDSIDSHVKESKKHSEFLQSVKKKKNFFPQNLYSIFPLIFLKFLIILLFFKKEMWNRC